MGPLEGSTGHHMDHMDHMGQDHMDHMDHTGHHGDRHFQRAHFCATLQGQHTTMQQRMPVTDAGNAC